MLRHKHTVVLGLLLLVILYLFKAAWWAYGLVFLVSLALTIWGASDIRVGYFVKTYNCNPQEKARRIAISFDDGPHPMTEKVLDLLQKYDAKGTFFCIGKQIEKHPDIFKRIIAEGHTVGNHSYSHSNRFGIFPSQKVIEEIRQTDQLIKKLSGKRVLFFRPPFGVTNPKIARAVKKTRHKVIGWNNRSLDTVIADENRILERVKRKVAPGGIILLHDTSLKTVTVLEQLLLFLHSEKYKMQTIDTLLNLPAYED